MLLTNDELFEEYLKIMLRITGLSRDVLLSTRRYPVSYYRAMLIKVMRDDRGLTTIELGRLINRDHSTVIHMLNQLQIAITESGYREVMMVWLEFKAEVSEFKARSNEEGERSINDMAMTYAGVHCDRRCDICRIKADACRYLQDEKTFLAGAEAQRSILRKAINELSESTAECALLCGKDNLKKVFAELDKVLATKQVEYV